MVEPMEPASPKAEDRPLLDGPAKVTGRAEYTHDLKPKGMLWARVLRCPHAHARVKSLDVSAAGRMPGVKAVRVIQGPGTEIQWALDEVAALAATSEAAAEEALRAIAVEYEVLPHFVTEEKLDQAPQVEAGAEEKVGDPDAALAAAEVKLKGIYGVPVVAHNCLETHGLIVQWTGPDSLTAWCSAEAAAAVASQLAEGVGIPAANVRVIAEYVGGGYGSKRSADRWGVECARLAKLAGAPVKLMLDRRAEITVAGDRPSVYGEVEVGAKKDGTLTAWSSKSWGSGGVSTGAGAGHPPIPYVFQVPDRRHRHSAVPTHRASARPWSAADHPQGAFITMCALDDLAAALGMNPLDVLLLNLPLTGPLEKVYREELKVADELMGWRQRWHPRGDAAKGPVKRGLGLSLHTWGDVTAAGANPGQPEPTSRGAGGVQMADVSVDVETGVVRINKVVAVQDCGLIIDLKATESQVSSGLAMGISAALAEEKVLDPLTGVALTTDFETYKMAGIADVGELVVHLMTGPGYDEREGIDPCVPPMISPGPALANAVTNAIGVRIPFLPLTPRRVLEAIAEKTEKTEKAAKRETA